MVPKTINKRGHRAGQWFTTEKPGSIEDLPGAFGLGELILVILFTIVYAIIVRMYRFMLRLKSSSGKWEDYQGLVYCQVHNDNLHFFTTIRGTSRILMKPAGIVRPLANLVRFKTYSPSHPSLAFTFSDGLEVKLYSIGPADELTKFRELVNAEADLL